MSFAVQDWILWPMVGTIGVLLIVLVAVGLAVCAGRRH